MRLMNAYIRNDNAASPGTDALPAYFSDNHRIGVGSLAVAGSEASCTISENGVVSFTTPNPPAAA